jgi:hypothetical protein
VVLLPAAGSGSSSSSSSSNGSSTADALNPSFLGGTQSFRFSAENTAVTKRDLGECVTAADVTGVEAALGEDLLIPPVRTLNDMGLPKLLSSDASGEWTGGYVGAWLGVFACVFGGGGSGWGGVLVDQRALF